MNELSALVFNLSVVTLILSILEKIVSDKRGKIIAALVGGLVFTIVALQGWKNIEIDYSEILQENTGQTDVSYYKNQYRQTLEKCISEKFRSYILDKAADVGIVPESISIVVQEQENTLIPNGVKISGSYSSSQQNILSAWMETELGISKEKQQWSRKVNG